MSYLCNRNRETKIANDKVPWMSGLVSGLQNRVRRFESARNLQKQERIRMKISNPFVFQLLTFFAVKEREEFFLLRKLLIIRTKAYTFLLNRKSRIAKRLATNA